MTTLTQIQSFLGTRRLAIVGVSRNARDITRALFEEFRTRGYDVVPVNPHTPEIDHQPCYARVADIDPPPGAVLLMTSPEVTERVVRECYAAGIRDIWMYRGGGKGAVNHRAVEFCRANGVALVEGECPFMFLPRSGWIHRVHGFCRKMAGSYPS